MMISFIKLSLDRKHLPIQFAIVSVFLLMCSVAITASGSEARRHVSLEGVLGSKVVLSIDGQRNVMSEGQTINGVNIIKIHPNSAVVKIGKKSKHLKMGDQSFVASPYKKRKVATVIVSPDDRGMYTSVGSINGITVNFLIDTGASTIAMNTSQAKRLGIDYINVGTETMVGTASGVAKAYRVKLDKVTLGAISVKNIIAVVIVGGFPKHTLLGMSFLGQVEIQRQGNVMQIKQRY